MAALRRRLRKDIGVHRRLSQKLRLALRAQYEGHKSWSYQLHADNLIALAQSDPALGEVPSYSTLRRYLKAQGMFKQRRPRSVRSTAGALEAQSRLERWEVRSFEAEYVHGLWHLDFHHGSRKLTTREGELVTPMLLGVLDDRSRLVCHLQWYLDETAETLVHGLSQAIQKPRPQRCPAVEPLVPAPRPQQRLLHGVLGLEGRPEHPVAVRGQLHPVPLQPRLELFRREGRLVAMLEGCEELTLELLNEATQAWVEMEYNRAVHSEIGCSPLARYLEGPEVGRESPSSEELRRAFRAEASRTQRRSDGTISLEGRRFEVPSRYRHLERLRVRYARWDLRSVDLVDPRTGVILCALYPLDKTANADGRRRRLDLGPEADPESGAPAPAPGIAPLLRKLMADYAATGLPPAYLPQHTTRENAEEETNTP